MGRATKALAALSGTCGALYLLKEEIANYGGKMLDNLMKSFAYLSVNGASNSSMVQHYLKEIAPLNEKLVNDSITYIALMVGVPFLLALGIYLTEELIERKMYKR